MKKFNEQECMEVLRQLRWGEKLRCVYCNSEKISKYGKDRKGFVRYICKECKKGFNEKSGTIFDRSQISIEEWFSIIYDYKKKSLMRISKELGKPYNTIHACSKKIKEDKLAMIIKDFINEKETPHNPKVRETEFRWEDPEAHKERKKQLEIPKRKKLARKPKILMLGWEFYPKMVGGLGKVCYELAKSLKNKADLTIILPINVDHEGLNIIPANVSVYSVKTLLSPYLTESAYRKLMANNEKELYGWNIFEEAERFADKCAEIASKLDFDIIHAHDWMTFRAALKIKQNTGKPLVLHVHTTEIDRGCGLGVNQRVFDLEKESFEKSDMIFAVSDYTKSKIVQHYGIDESKIKVIHNALDSEAYEIMRNMRKDNENKIVLYFGRVTMHKGPDYFIHAARKVLDHYKNVTFVVAGTGDMLTKMIELSCHLGMGNKVLFTGYLNEKEAKEIYKMADIYIMPSVSEPFGVTALEAMASGVPTILTKSSGVSEIASNCFKVDFWDIDEMANKIISCLKYSSLPKCMSENCIIDVKKLSWDKQAERCVDYYSHLLVGENS